MDTAALRQQIGHRIRLRRVELRLEQSELAERLGILQSQISLWESGGRGIRLEQAVMLAAALNTSVGYLVGEEPRPHSPSPG